MAVLLQEGIGDTIRVSLTPEPGGDRTQEVIVAQEMLQTMGLRSFTPMVVACPGCGRTTSTYFQELAQKIQSHLRHRMPEWRKRYLGVEEMTVAVMGCVVNGPGESKHANIGISLPGTGERPVAPVYIDGEKGPTLKGERIAEEFQQLVEEYVARTYAGARTGSRPHDAPHVNASAQPCARGHAAARAPPNGSSCCASCGRGGASPRMARRSGARTASRTSIARWPSSTPSPGSPTPRTIIPTSRSATTIAA